jgi:hypothetical protein
MSGQPVALIASLLLPALAFGQTTSTTLSASPNPANYGQPVTLTATVTASATGKVTFYDGVTILGVATLSGTQASLTTVMLASGSGQLRAYYQGDGTHVPSASAALSESIIAGPSSGLQSPIDNSGATAIAIAKGDFNGDHVQDLVMSTSPTSTVTIYLGNGDGTFQAGQPYSAGTALFDLAVGDFNGDGKLDVAGVDRFGGNVWILLGNGDGSFQSPVPVPVGFVTRALAVADFNGDGNADIVVVGYNDSGLSAGVSILLGNGDGSFSIPGGILPWNGVQVTVSDFNGDGKPDFAFTLNGGISALYILLGNGDGTFQSPLITQGLSPSAIKLVAADLNADGKPDLVLADEGDGVFVLLGNGDGTFAAPATYNPGNNGAATVIVEDFNGDGKPDLAIAPYLSDNFGGLALLSANGDGTFQSPVWYAVKYSYYAIYFYFAVAGDFNGDGTIDLAFASNFSGTPVFLVLLGGAGSDLTILTDPAQLQVVVNGRGAEVAPQTLDLPSGTAGIDAPSPQAGPPGIQYVFANWSDGGAESHTIAVGTTPTVYTATFVTQYELTATQYPIPGGAVTPASGAYFNPGAVITLTATPNAPYVFTSWSNGSTANPLQFTLIAPTSLIANFYVPGFTCAITGDSSPSIADVQQIVNEALGVLPPNDNLAHNPTISVVDIQKVLDAAIGLPCLY